MVALYFVGLAVWQAVYIGQIDDASNRLMTFIQLVSSVFTLMLGLLEAMNDYKMKAHLLHNCALAVSELAQELNIARPKRSRSRAGVPATLQRRAQSLPGQPLAPRLHGGEAPRRNGPVHPDLDQAALRARRVRALRTVSRRAAAAVVGSPVRQ